MNNRSGLSAAVVSMQFSLFDSSDTDVLLDRQTCFPGEWQIICSVSPHSVSVGFAGTEAQLSRAVGIHGTRTLLTAES